MTDLTGEVVEPWTVEAMLARRRKDAEALGGSSEFDIEEIEAVATTLAQLTGENEALRHDLERQMDIANAECNEAEGYRAALERIARGEFGYGSGAKPFFASPISLAVETLKARASSGDTE